MPNRDPNFQMTEMPELDEFFRPIANVLTDFARRHNLKLTKYYHYAPSWSFAFRHPCGGVGKVEVCREHSEALQVLCSWWFDDYDKLTRFIKTYKGESLPRDSQMLDHELEQSLNVVLAWLFGTWDEQQGGYHSWKNTWTKEQFNALLEQYPDPHG